MNINPNKEEIHLRLMQIIFEAEQKITQRDLSKRAGISLGKVNYWIGEMVEEGLISIERGKNEGGKSAFTYMLTQKAIEEKYRLLIHILSRKIREHKTLEKEIDALNREIQQYSAAQQQSK